MKNTRIATSMLLVAAASALLLLWLGKKRSIAPDQFDTGASTQKQIEPIGKASKATQLAKQSTSSTSKTTIPSKFNSSKIDKIIASFKHSEQVIAAPNESKHSHKIREWVGKLTPSLNQIAEKWNDTSQLQIEFTGILETPIELSRLDPIR